MTAVKHNNSVGMSANVLPGTRVQVYRAEWGHSFIVAIHNQSMIWMWNHTAVVLDRKCGSETGDCERGATEGGLVGRAA
jgi:hypothetical protein